MLSSTILFGTGIGTASVMIYGHRTKNPIVIAAISKRASQAVTGTIKVTNNTKITTTQSLNIRLCYLKDRLISHQIKYSNKA